VLLQLGARIAEERRLAEEMEEVRQELYLEEEAERERLRQLAELDKRQRQREEMMREQEMMKIERQLRMQAERDQEDAYRQQVINNIIIFWPTNTKSGRRNIKGKQTLKAGSSVSLGDYCILEGDRIPSLYSYGQALKQRCCLPGVLCGAGDAPANLLCEFDSHVVPCGTSCLDSKQMEDMGAKHPDVLICHSLSHFMGCHTHLGSFLSMWDSAKVSGTVTSKAIGLPLANGKRVVLSGCLLSSRIRLTL